MPYITLFPSNTADSSEDSDDKSKRYVYIHPSSVLAHTSADKLPQYLVYSHLSRSSPSSLTSSKMPKTRMHPLTHVSTAQLVALAQGTLLLEEGKPVGKVEVLKRDAKGRERRQVLTVPFLKGETGGMGWPLPPARSVVQVRMPGKGWVVEE
jgi:ATP-dependent RNA helicase DHX37/DHR1